MEAAPVRPSLALRRLINGFQISQAIHVAATLGVADLLRDGPRSSTDLAVLARADPDALRRVLSALAAVDVLHEDNNGEFSLTDIGRCLCDDAPEPLGPWAAYVGDPHYWQAWGDLLHTVRTGENAFSNVHGVDTWTYRANRPDLGDLFNRAMAANSMREQASILGAYDFSAFEMIVDVGGGNGTLLAAILARNPGAMGLVFDQPHVVSGASNVLDAAGVANRCTAVGGSFFDEIPTGGSAYLLKSIIHDWADREAAAILASCRRAMSTGTCLLVIERELGGPNENPDAKFMDITMMVAPGGRERSHDEYQKLLESNGFRLNRVVFTGTGPAIFEAFAI